MQQFANWTNLSETTFVLPPRAAGADYLVRIFTASGSCRSPGIPRSGPATPGWRPAGGPPDPDVVVQECEAGLVTVRRTEAGLAFAAPPLMRSGPVEEAIAERVAAGAERRALRHRGHRVGRQRPRLGRRAAGQRRGGARGQAGRLDLDIGVAGPYPDGSPEALEVRAFTPVVTSAGGPGHGQPQRLARAVAAGHRAGSPPRTWPVRARRWAAAAGCTSRRTPSGQVWVGGGTVTCITGSVVI